MDTPRRRSGGDTPPRIRDFLRITVGTPEQMEVLLEALKRILEGE